MTLQAADFKRLYEVENCVLQIGGSDQWGNITAGVDLIRRTLRKEAVRGICVPHNRVLRFVTSCCAPRLESLCH